MEAWDEKENSEALIDLFGKVRDEWMETDLASWISANSILYPGVSDALRFTSSKIYIVTTKQMHYCENLLPDQLSSIQTARSRPGKTEQFGSSDQTTTEEKCVCDWEGLENRLIEVERILRRQIQMSVVPSVQPFHAFAYPLDPLLALEISHKYAEHCSLVASRYSLPSFSYPALLPVKTDEGSRRLRVGYVSSDFGNHPLSHLMGSVFGMHDRENVEIFCYALSPSDGSEWRLRTQSEAEHFVDVSLFWGTRYTAT